MKRIVICFFITGVVLLLSVVMLWVTPAKQIIGPSFRPKENEQIGIYNLHHRGDLGWEKRTSITKVSEVLVPLEDVVTVSYDKQSLFFASIGQLYTVHLNITPWVGKIAAVEIKEHKILFTVKANTDTANILLILGVIFLISGFGILRLGKKKQ